MTTPVVLTLPDGARILVPQDLNRITPYVLHEQGDWFEQDIHFVRQILCPGDQVVDIGANHGVYTLSMAQSVGPEGHVWAFEPGAAVRSFLNDSVAINDYAQVTVLGVAVSHRTGQAWLSGSGHTELGKLSDGPAAVREEVVLTTLDAAMAEQGWPDLAFMKVDAEGEESNILRGGTGFLADRSPLVMYEVRADSHFSIDLVDQFAGMGYASYKLVPGLGMLVPFHRGDALDAFALNLYACKPDRAARLAQAGRLIPHGTPSATLPASASQAWWTAAAGWPYAQQRRALWAQRTQQAVAAGLAEALFRFVQSQDTAAPAGQRWAALQLSLGIWRAAVELQATPTRLASLARVAAAAGERVLALNALTQILQSWASLAHFDTGEPFLPALQRFETLTPPPDPAAWFVAAVLEAHESLSSHSSFYADRTSLPRLEMISQLGYASPEMQRRLRLMRARFPTAAPAVAAA